MSRTLSIILGIGLGLAAIGCTRDEPRGDVQARTTGMEEPVQAEPGAREPTAQTRTVPQPVEPTQISEAEISDFADVIIRLAALEQEAAARVDAGQPPEQVSAELQPQVDLVFEGTALTADRFKEIADQAEHDPMLRQRIELVLQERVQQAPPA